jgi:hypothetical protein
VAQGHILGEFVALLAAEPNVESLGDAELAGYWAKPAASTA